MKAHRVCFVFVNLDDVSEDDIKSIVENTKYPNHCMHPDVVSIETRDIGKWHEDHPLNQLSTVHEEYARIFNTPLPNIKPIETKLADVPKPAQRYMVYDGTGFFVADNKRECLLCKCYHRHDADRIAQLLNEAQKPEPPF